LLLLNGSPRGASSNSMKMLSRVAEGWQRAGGGKVEALHLARRADFERAVEAFGEADTVLVGMPLYADAMPSLVKAYVEELARYVGREGNPALAFVVQSGFSEALHSRGLERYFEKLARRLGSPYAGTIVRGGGESLRSMPDEASKKLWARLIALGESLRRDTRFDPELLGEVAGVERFGPVAAALVGVGLKLPLGGMMWPELKKNGAWDRRDAHPYVSP
jgi:Flavodoxin-like fold